MLADQVADFLTKKKRRSLPTYEQYRFILERVLLPWCEESRIREASALALHMEGLVLHLEHRQHNGKPLATATIRTYIRGVRVFLKWTGQPNGDYEIPRERERLRDVLSRQEVDRMERVARDERDRLIVRLLADTGARVSEVLGLRESDLRGDSHSRKYFVRVIGKGDREREIGLPEEVFKRLKHFATHGVERDYIFISKRGDNRLTRHGVDQLIHKLAHDAGIERRIWPHLFRHSFVTEMARKKVPIQEVMKAVGHRTAAMTMVVYNQTTAYDSYDTLMAALKT